MSERERWMVYPLLFLSLGVGLRGHFGTTHQIRCNKLLIQRPDGLPQLELTTAPADKGGGGLVQVFSDEGRLGVEMRAVQPGGVVETIGTQAVIQALGLNGFPQARLESTPNGGALIMLTPDRRPLVVAQPPPFGATVTTYGPNGRQQSLLGKPWGSPTPREKPAADDRPGESESHEQSAAGEAAKRAPAGQSPASETQSPASETQPSAPETQPQPTEAKPDEAADESPRGGSTTGEPAPDAGRPQGADGASRAVENQPGAAR